MAFDTNGYEVRWIRRSKYKLYSPDGKFIRAYSSANPAWNAAQRHFDDKPTKTMKCMSCPRMFESTGFGHRMCDPCRMKPNGMD